MPTLVLGLSSRRLLAASVAVAVCFGLLGGISQPADAAPEAARRPSGEPVAGRYIVMLAEAANERDVRAAHGIARASVRASYRSAFNGFAAQMPEAAAARLSADPRVLRVEPDRWRTVAATQWSPPSWGLDRIDERLLPMSGSYTYGTTGRGVKAYVVDTGIRRTHDDFGSRVAAGWYAGPPFVHDGFFTSTNDCTGHGTHVAGTLGGRYSGVAKGVTIVPVKALGLTDKDEPCGQGGYDSDVIAGIDWMVADHGAGQPAVANLSLGGTAEKAEALEAAVGSAIADGITFVVAAGNEDQNACNISPARVPEVITVGATDRYDTRASFSNYAGCVDLFAPGVRIWSAGIVEDSAIVEDSGTSMAAPHVAGAAARYLQLKPGATPAEVDAYIKAEATSGSVLDPGPDSPNRLLYAEPPARVKISVSAKAVTYGQTMTVTGQVFDGDDTFDTGETVKLQRRRAGTSRWKTLTSAPPSPHGDVSFSVKPRWSADYRLRFSGGDEQPATSRRVRVGVRTRVTSALSTSTAKVGDVVRMRGAVLPSHAGKSVTLQRYRDGRWRSIKSDVLNEKSKYVFRLGTATRGKHRYRVVMPAHTDHLRGKSPIRTLTVG